MEKQVYQLKQVRDVLTFGSHLHAEMKRMAEKMESEEHSTRLKLLLEYLQRHEGEMAASLIRFEENTQPHILDLWLPYPPDARIETKLQSLKIHPDMSLEEIVKVVMEFEDALIELYRESLNEIDDPHVQEILNNLLQLEDAEKHRFAMNVARFHEM